MQKKTLIADLVHYPISLTQVEKAILQDPIFNRLHGVKQNSTAYLTFPSMNHVRFSHSLGAMHLAGSMCRSGFLNAEVDVAKKFLDIVGDVVDEIFAESKAEINRRFPNTSDDITPLTKLDVKHVLGVFHEYSQWSLAPNFESKYSLLAYCCIQAVRIAALTHDLGHPPFSHVTEYAVKDLAEEYLNRDSALSMTNREAGFKKFASEFVKCPPHELLTRELFAEQILSIVIPAQNTDELVSFIFVFVTLRLAQLILDDKDAGGGTESQLAQAPLGEVDRSEVIFALHSLVSSDFDADRLDYVYRDTLMSGIRFESVRNGRLIELIRLEQIEASVNAPQKLRFLPHVRALRSLEDFFSARIELYRSVIYHHHVIKTDAILYASVLALSKQWLSNSSGKVPDLKEEKFLRSDVDSIHWLWNIFGLNISTNWSAATRNVAYLQWDDGWLQSLLRTKYLELRNVGVGSMDVPSRILFNQLEELLSGKRNYVSLIKRFDDYCDFNDALWQALDSHIESLNQNSFDIPDPSEKKKRTARSEITTWLFDNSKKKNERREIDILSHFRDIGFDIEVAIARPSCEEYLKDFQGVAMDLIFSCKSMGSGFHKDFLVATDRPGKPVKFTDHSRVAKSLVSSSISFPSIFFFVLPKRPNLDKAAILSTLAKYFAKELVRQINQ